MTRFGSGTFGLAVGIGVSGGIGLSGTVASSFSGLLKAASL